jgi:hypothetical protein
MNIPNSIPNEIWKNEPKPEPISASVKEYFLQFGGELKTNGSEELTLEPGESVELTFGFGPDHSMTGPRTKTFKKKDWNTGKNVVNPLTGEEVMDEITRPNFEVFNHKLKKKQNLWIADKWAKIAWDTMQEYNTTTLQVRRIGEKKDTTYTFMPTGLKRSG